MTVKNAAWLDTHQWGVRGFKRGNKAAHNGFQFLRGWNSCPDWEEKPQCGNGFHLVTPEASGSQFYGEELKLVEWGGQSVKLNDKIKVSELRIVACTHAVLAEALKRCGYQFIAGHGPHEVTSGICVVLRGAPRITQSGGKVWTYDRSAPRITQSGGKVWTYDRSAPRITQSGGSVCTYDRSAPRITQSGGKVWTYDRSAPRITQSGGKVWTSGRSAPRIKQKKALKP